MRRGIGLSIDGGNLRYTPTDQFVDQCLGDRLDESNAARSYLVPTAVYGIGEGLHASGADKLPAQWLFVALRRCRALTSVKKHVGTTDEYAVKQLVKMLQKEPSADGCVMSLAGDFSPGAQRLAEVHGITLVNGDTICRLLLGRLATP